MQISFSFDNNTAVFTRHWFTGRASLTVAGKEYPVASPWRLSTQIEIRLERTWHVDVLGHTIAIVKKRPLFLSGAREQTYRIFVDGEQIAEQTGY